MVAASSIAGSVLASFDRLFLEQYARVVAIAYRIARDADTAEDVAQEVFMKCARGGVAERAHAAAWLHRAAAHAALNAVRSRRRRSRRELREYRLTQPLFCAPKMRDPQRILETESDRAAVRRALLRIPARDAHILALRYAGLSYAEIAQSLSIAAPQVGTRLARAERAFRREIERETPG